MTMVENSDANSNGSRRWHNAKPISKRSQTQGQTQPKRKKENQRRITKTVEKSRKRTKQRESRKIKRNYKRKRYKSKPTVKIKMNAAGGGNKRAAQPGPQSIMKKKTKDDSNMELDLSQIIEESAWENNDEVPIRIVEKLYSVQPLIEKHEPVDEHGTWSDISCKPYIGLFGSGTNYLHNDLQRVTRTAAKLLIYKTSTLDSEQLLEISKKAVISQEDWVRFFPSLIIPAQIETSKTEKYCTTEEIAAALCMAQRLAHTDPTQLFGRIKNGKVPADNRSNAWYGAVMTCGSWYHKTKRQSTLQGSLLEADLKKTGTGRPKRIKKKKATGKKIAQTEEDTDDEEDGDEDEITVIEQPEEGEGKTSSEEPVDTHQENEDTSSNNNDETMEQESQVSNKENDGDEIMEKADENSTKTQTNQNTAPTQAKKGNDANSKKKVEKAKAVADRRQYKHRMQLRIQIGEKDKEKTAATMGLETLQSLLTHYQTYDPKTIIVPWKEEEMTKYPAITKAKNFPMKLSEFKPYADRFRPKAKAGVWLKMRIAANTPGENFTSKDGSDAQDWFDDEGALGYLCCVQNSEDVVEVGYFVYSGAFIDVVRLQAEILKELEAGKADTEWKIGCRVKRCVELEKTNEGGHWCLANNQMVAFEADRKQAKSIAGKLTRRFNPQEDGPLPVMQRPGNYQHLRFLPAPEFVRQGTRGKTNRNAMLRKHQAIVQSLDLIINEDIKKLDEETKMPSGEIKTLRSILMNLTYPLAPKPGQATRPLIHTVDFAASGRDAGSKVYITAYKDRSELVSKLVDVLPVYIAWEERADDSIIQKWFHPLLETPVVKWHTTGDGAWTGGWTTEDDLAQQSLINEDMGIDVQLENMAILGDNNQRIYQVDDQSVGTFGLSKPSPLANGQDESDTDAESLASASSAVTEGSGLTT